MPKRQHRENWYRRTRKVLRRPLTWPRWLRALYILTFPVTGLLVLLALLMLVIAEDVRKPVRKILGFFTAKPEPVSRHKRRRKLDTRADDRG